MRTRERGFTLIEVVIGVAIIVMTVASGIAISLASKPSAVSAAAARFDALLDAARTEAHAYDTGVTIAFTEAPGASGSIGFRAQLYRGRPALGSLVALNVPILDAAVDVDESEVLHAPAFALTIHGDGAVAGVVAYTPAGASASPETACPASGAYHFIFSAAGQNMDRYVPCHIALAATGPVTYASLPPGGGGGTEPTPGACTNAGCASPPPTQTSTCPPPSFQAAGGGCIVSPLVVNPTAIVLPRANAPAQTVTASEASYSGPLQITSTNCDTSFVTLSGGGNGPNTSFSASSSQPETCSFTVADNHGGAQTIPLTTYGNLTVTPGSLAFSSPSSPPQTITAHEDFYPGVISTDLATPDAAGDPGCASYASIDSAGRNTDPLWDAAFLVTPQRFILNQCEVTLRDDHGGSLQVRVAINEPTTTCPDGTTVGLGTPCPKPQLLICSLQPVGTDLGPDPDGTHEDVSVGRPCPTLRMVSGTTTSICPECSDPDIVTHDQYVLDMSADGYGTCMLADHGYDSDGTFDTVTWSTACSGIHVGTDYTWMVLFLKSVLIDGQQIPSKSYPVP